MAAVIRKHGGKHYLAKRIIDMMPPHTKFLEAYAGGAAVTLAKDPFDPRHVVGSADEGCAEWINDLDGELSIFWRVMSDPMLFGRFHRQIEGTPFSQVAFEEAQEATGTSSSAVQIAVMFFIKARQSRQGLCRDYATPTSRTRRGMNENVSAWLTAVDGLADVHQRLRTIEVWSRPAVEAIKALDHEHFLTYCDPPYLAETRSTVGEYGALEMDSDQHRELLECLAGMQGKFLLSGYHSPLYDDFAQRHGWRVVEFDLPNNASSGKEKERKVECVWVNYG